LAKVEPPFAVTANLKAVESIETVDGFLDSEVVSPDVVEIG
jgi:hypothetical protein